MTQGFKIVALLCLLAGCSAPQQSHEPQPEVHRIEHAGHDYLKFYELGSTSFVHDPDCRCGENK